MEKVSCLIPTYDELTTSQIEILNQNSYTVKFKKNETIFHQDMPVSHIIYLKSGLIKIFREENEKKVILTITKPENFCGLLSSFSGNKYDYSGSSLIDSELVFVDIQVFKNIIKENGNFSLHILGELCKKGLFIFDKLINVSHKQVPGRLAGMILFFSTSIFKNSVFEIPLSRQELADLISTTKESVSRTLNEFKNDLIIDINDRKIEIKSFELLNMLERIG